MATTRPIESSLQALLAARFRAQTQMVAELTDHPVLEAVGKLLFAVAPTIPGDRTRVDRAFSFLQSYLATAKAPAEECPSLPI